VSFDSFDCVPVLDVPVRAVTRPVLVEWATSADRACSPATVMYANAHVLNIAFRDSELRAILNQASLVYCDGAGVVLAARLLGRRLPGRMTGADWINPLCAACAETGTSLFLLGSRPGVARRAAQTLERRHPGLVIAGAHHGYLDNPRVCQQAVALANAVRPHILLAGMGTPTQEKWIAAHRHELDAPVVWAVGALFDFVTGVQPRGPRWMLDHGLEWLCRLTSDPRRLWHRYLLGNPLFLLRVLRQRFGGRALAALALCGLSSSLLSDRMIR